MSNDADGMWGPAGVAGTGGGGGGRGSGGAAGGGAAGGGTAGGGPRAVPWGDVLLWAVVSVSWAVLGMAGVAALGLHLLGADAAGSLGPMAAAAVALAVGGSVTPSGDVSAFGLSGAQADTAVTVTPLGVGLAGALLLAWCFLRSLRAAGVVVPLSELLARVGTVLVLFAAVLGGLAWVGHDVITFDGASLGLDDLPGGDRGGDLGGGLGIPGLGDLGDLDGLLPDRLGGLIDAKASVGFTVDTAPTLLGGLAWAAGVLVIALLVSRRTPLPPRWNVLHRVVRPAASAMFTVLLVTVAAGLAAALYATAGDDHPRRVLGAALLGAPNGVWLGLPLGLFVPAHGRATGQFLEALPDPLDKLLAQGADESVTVSRLAGLDGRVWFLVVGAALTMLLAGVLTAARTPVSPDGVDSVDGAGRFAGRCALRLGVITALTLPLLSLLTQVSADATLSVLGFDAFGAGLEVSGDTGMALLLGAVWGAGAGAAGALLARGAGVAGSRAAPLARLAVRWAGGRPVAGGPSADGPAPSGASASDVSADVLRSSAAPSVPARPDSPAAPGPYADGRPSYRAPNPATNPYLRVPDELRKPQDRPDETAGRSGADPEDGHPGPPDGRPDGERGGPGGPGGRGGRGRPPQDVAGAPTVAGLPYPTPPPPPAPPPPPPPVPPSSGRPDS